MESLSFAAGEGHYLCGRDSAIHPPLPLPADASHHLHSHAQCPCCASPAVFFLLSQEKDIITAIEDAGFDASVISRSRLLPPSKPTPATITPSMFTEALSTTQPMSTPSCVSSSTSTLSSSAPSSPLTLTRLVVSIDGMTCSACSSAVESALSALPAVTSASVALLQNQGEVVFDGAAMQVRRGGASSFNDA